MDPVVAALLIDLVIIPLVQELARRRDVHGVNKETLGIFLKDPSRAADLLEKLIKEGL